MKGQHSTGKERASYHSKGQDRSIQLNTAHKMTWKELTGKTEKYNALKYSIVLAQYST